MAINKIISWILIFLYLCIPYLPLFGEIDRIASQWTFLSVLNFLTLIFITFRIKLFELKNILLSNFTLFYGLFLLFSIISMINATNLTESFVEFFRYFSVFLLIILLPFLVTKFENYKTIIFFMVFYSLIDVLGIFLQYNTDLPLIGFTGNKNIASASLIIKSNAILFLCSKYKNIFSRIFVFIFTLCTYSVIFLIGSKAGFLSSIIVMILLLVFATIKKLKSKFNLIIVFSILCAILISSISNKTIQNNIEDTVNITNDTGSTDRLRYYGQAFQAFIEYPLTGIGIGNWKIYSIKYDSRTMNNYVVQYHTHNDYIQFFAEIGIGAIFYVLFIVYFFIVIVRLFKLHEKIDEDSIAILMISILGYCIYLIDSNLNFPAARVVMQINLASILALLLSIKHKNIQIENN